MYLLVYYTKSVNVQCTSTVIIVGAAAVTRAEGQSFGPTGKPSSSSPQPREAMPASGSGLRTSPTIQDSTVQTQKVAERSPQSRPRDPQTTKDTGDNNGQRMTPNRPAIQRLERSPIYTVPDIHRVQQQRRGSGSPSTMGTDQEVYVFSF
jgi:hypothetical protein